MFKNIINMASRYMLFFYVFAGWNNLNKLNWENHIIFPRMPGCKNYVRLKTNSFKEYPYLKHLYIFYIIYLYNLYNY